MLKKGFTLIEIVIVLAIAAAIMIIVFFAVAGSQRSQRDQSRKEYANQAAAKIVEYSSNHNNDASTMTFSILRDNYMGGREINGQAPDNAVGALDNEDTATTPTGTGCVDATPADLEASVRFSGGDVIEKNWVAICLETGDWYVVQP